jgi:hypothetical protein
MHDATRPPLADRPDRAPLRDAREPLVCGSRPVHNPSRHADEGTAEAFDRVLQQLRVRVDALAPLVSPSAN